MSVRFLALAMAATALCFAQTDLDLVVEPGAPLRIRVDEKTPIRESRPVRGTLTHALYVFDREVAPAGSTVLGRIVAIDKASGGEKARTYLRGQLRTRKEARVAFETLLLADGGRFPVTTAVTAGAPAVVKLLAGGAAPEQPQGTIRKTASEAKRAVKDNALVRALRSGETAKAAGRQAASGRWRGLRNALLAYWPFGERNLPAGAGFTAVLEEPLYFGDARIEADDLAHIGTPPAPDSIVEARLLETVSSETAKVGSEVRALITKPLHSAEGDLIVPEGATLVGEVTQVEPARRFGRNGKLRFRFSRIEMPSGLARLVSGSLNAAEVDAAANMEIDAEGGAALKTSKKRFIMPALSVAVAMAGPPGDEDGVPTGSTAQGAVPGFSGLGILGSAISLGARPAAGPIGVWGAANSLYFNLVRKANELEFPKHTLLEIRLGRSPEDAAIENLESAEGGREPTPRQDGLLTRPVDSETAIR